MYHRVDLVPSLVPREVVRQLRVVGEVAALDQHEEVAPLLIRDRTEADVAVGRRLDRRDLDRAAGARRAEARDERRERRHRKVQHLEHGYVHVPAVAGPPGRAPGGERADRGVAAGEPLAERPPAAIGGRSTVPRIAVAPPTPAP
jgi:hypothetical protein